MAFRILGGFALLHDGEKDFARCRSPFALRLEASVRDVISGQDSDVDCSC